MASSVEAISAHPVDGHGWLAEVDPEYETMRRNLAGAIWNPKKGALPLHIREIIAVVVMAYKGHPTVGVHIRRAIEAGAKFREVLEALQTVCMPGGHLCLHYALPYLKEVHAELGCKPNEGDARGPSAPGKTEWKKLTKWSYFDENYPDYEAAREVQMRMVWTPENPVLPIKYREIMATVILSVICYESVVIHIRRAIREGATFDEMIEALQTASFLAGMEVLHFTLPFLKQIRSEIDSGQFSE